MDRDDAILNYLQNRLAPEDRAQFEASMTQDASLSAEVDLMRSVRADLAAAPKHQNSDAVWARLAASIDPVPQPANENRRPWMQVLRYAAVACIAVAAWQFTIVPRTGSVSEGFRTSSERAPAFILQVKFVESATIGEIGTLLAALGGTISDGPSALGVVRVSFPDQASQREAMEALSARTDLVEIVLEQ
ncbi:hypothetical protein [Roseobacter weihaiensis]|uniref:hypothetical protein n=1 Tax=Roseobacter weihaiensis TaxID=2763262 RepID=UPI001D0B1A56|nr:hypothetical protein [Roseobacter sp. H9]